jgi:hypothetical protein
MAMTADSDYEWGELFVECPCCKGSRMLASSRPDYFGNYETESCSLCEEEGVVDANTAAAWEATN